MGQKPKQLTFFIHKFETQTLFVHWNDSDYRLELQMHHQALSAHDILQIDDTKYGKDK